MPDKPKISFVVVVYKMARQAANTLFTLSAAYQRNVSESDYEVIVVENRSDDLLGETEAVSYGRHISYFLREETGVSPAGALNFGCRQARAPYLCLMIDGARMLSPRVAEYALLARKISRVPLVAVPGYHLGPNEQLFSKTYGYDETVEQKLLDSVDWRKDGYLLFDISHFSGANRTGFFSPMMECNCLCCLKESFEKTGMADVRFNLPGGGILNLEIFRSLLELPESLFIVLPGEGSFHQFHSGVTTQESDRHDALFEAFVRQYEEMMGKPFQIFPREPLLLGAVTGPVQRFVQESSQKALKRFNRLKNTGKPEWPFG